ncbi:malate dehydrogenase [Actinoplanes lobatus]|uniref:LDH2 family malate/lactate/ureidoglycolate dehydrogenase n=1 Tax=Actinoplanes lobatus TaxID=113568 RepID=A0A7W7HIR5_9ACTN|nr:Ldh family oxidoreductase [Actinoplanes lobatus]MBB4750922.1 LDH2 family malate/lactate/ureidoglycolate dehydrogenase [Actinoplanes lobatus]GGN86216.1 malate dehydrogenase [Actinoplanes lobatus]GIE43496.1 malate dehydrogenase [Actinoplanes lobatus]
MTSASTVAVTGDVSVAYPDLITFTTGVFEHHGVPAARARTAAEALCHGDLTGVRSHGLANLTRLYLPLFAEGRADPVAEPRVLADRGASVLLDGGRALGLWLAAEAVDLAVERAREHGVGLVSIRNATHFGCAGFHAARAVPHDMVGLLAGNCGRQRIARPPGARPALLGTNPLSIAAPAGPHHPFVLDMSTTVVPTGRIRAAERAGETIPVGWLEDTGGRAVTDPGALDRREAYVQWLGGSPETGAFKGYGLALLVEVLAAAVAGAGLGPDPEAFGGDGGPTGRDDDIGVFALAVAPGELRGADGFRQTVTGLFGALLDSPAVRPGQAVRYPGWYEAERAGEYRRDGVPLGAALAAELRTVAEQTGVAFPEVAR